MIETKPAEGVREGIVLSQVSKAYGSVQVLDGIDLSAPHGKRIALIGPSGSGKTTILRCIALLEGIDAGSIAIDGVVTSTEKSHIAKRGGQIWLAKRQIGMVFQQFNLFPNMTVLSNVTLAPIKVLGVARSEAIEQAMELLKTVGLHDKGAAYPHELSGGQQQRVAIARSLAMQPSVLLFDEVTSALDPELVGEVLEVIRRLAESSAVTMLIVTHEMAFARDVADQVAFMESGRIVELGAARQVLQDPQNARTQKFLRRLTEH